MNNNSYTANEMGDKPKELTMKEINRMYIDRIIQSLTEDKEKWIREVMCGMDRCFEDYYSPKYKDTNGNMISFSNKGLAGAHIDGMLVWTVGFWVYYNPFSNRSLKLREAMLEMKQYLINKDEEERLSKLKKIIE
jgi:hypothetical protein